MEDETSYSWQYIEEETTSNVSGYIQNGTGNIPVQNNITTDDSSVGTITYSVSPTTDFCPGESQTFTISVNPVPVINSFSETICNEGTFVDITPVDNTDGVVPAGTTYTWVIANTSSGAIEGASASTAASATITGSPLFNETNSPATLTYTVTPTSAEGCVGTPFTVTITVNPTGQVEPVSSQVVCNGDSTTVDFTTDNTGGTTTYTWSNTGGVDINIGPGETVNDSNTDITFTAVNESSEPISTEITVTPTFTNAGVSCVGPGETFTITVTPTAQVVEVEDIVLCNGGDSTEVVFTTENQNGTTLYTWTNNDTSIGLAASGTGNIASFNATNTTTAPVTATVIVTQLRQKVV